MPYCAQTFSSAKDAVEATIQLLTPLKDIVTNPAMVFDIDETLLYNHPSNDEKFTKNPPIIALYNWGRQNEIDMYIVTARPKEPANAKWTEDILKKIKIEGYKKIYYKPSEYQDKCSSQAKWKYRERICTKYKQTILVSVGDKWGDLLDMYDDGNTAFANTIGGDKAQYHLVTGDRYSVFGLKLKDDE